MIPAIWLFFTASISLSRVSGGDPRTQAVSDLADYVFPASAGVILRFVSASDKVACLSRVSGGDPWQKKELGQSIGSFPRQRG